MPFARWRLVTLADQCVKRALPLRHRRARDNLAIATSRQGRRFLPLGRNALLGSARLHDIAFLRPAEFRAVDPHLVQGGSGTVYIPLQPDDPLYVPGSPTNFMVLTRATVGPGADGVMGDDPLTVGIDESADDTRPVNTTTSWVDQNQTYTSHSSHQVFLREYVLNAR